MKTLALAIVMWSAIASAATAKRIIVSWNAGRERPTANHFILERTKGAYADGPRIVSAAVVQRLVDAVTATPVRDLDPRRLLADARLDEELEPYLRGAASSSASAFELFSTPDARDVLVRRYYASDWDVGNHERVSMEIDLDGGRVIHVTSDESFEFLLPWRIRDGYLHWFNWDEGLSRALAAVLPERALTQKLTGVDLAQAIVSSPLKWMTPGEFSDPFERANVATSASGAAGRFHDLNTLDEPGWLGSVRSVAWGKASFMVFLTREQQGFASIVPFLRDAPVLEARVCALRWLSSCSNVEIPYHDDRVLTAVGRQTILDDLRIGAPDREILSESALEEAIPFTFSSDGHRSLYVLLKSGTSVRVSGRCTPGPLCPPIGKGIAP